MKSYIKLAFICIGVWVFAWLAGSFAFATINIAEWSSQGRAIVATLSSFFCACIIPAAFVK